MVQSYKKRFFFPMFPRIMLFVKAIISHFISGSKHYHFYYLPKSPYSKNMQKYCSLHIILPFWKNESKGIKAGWARCSLSNSVTQSVKITADSQTTLKFVLESFYFCWSYFFFQKLCLPIFSLFHWMTKCLGSPFC